jgi:5'-3' exonuclease
MNELIPTEAQEQVRVVQYCDLLGYPRFRVPNETYTKSWSQKRKNKELGVSSGVPDLFVVVNKRLIGIEMKRIKRSSTSQSQLEWIAELNAAGVETRTCKGADEAIKFIKEVRVM